MKSPVTASLTTDTVRPAARSPGPVSIAKEAWWLRGLGRRARVWGCDCKSSCDCKSCQHCSLGCS
jgi:hypothetical protein